MSRQLFIGPLLMAVAATQGASCTSGAILGFSILLKDTSTCGSVPPQGSWGFEPAITSPPALPTEPQLPPTSSTSVFFIALCFIYLEMTIVFS